jgi:hypothetical protein
MSGGEARNSEIRAGIFLNTAPAPLPIKTLLPCSASANIAVFR